MWIVGRFVHPEDECYLPENSGYLSFIPVEARSRSFVSGAIDAWREERKWRKDRTARWREKR